jgi:hypothetical protein
MPARVDVLFDGELSVRSDVDTPNRSSADPGGSRSSINTVRSPNVLDLGYALAPKNTGSASGMSWPGWPKRGKYHQPRSTAMNVVTMVATVSSSNLQKSMLIAGCYLWVNRCTLAHHPSSKFSRFIVVLCVSPAVAECLRGTTRYPTRSRAINETLHRTNSPLRNYCLSKRSHKLVETVCQNPPRTHLGTFPITIGKSSYRTQDMATVH